MTNGYNVKDLELLQDEVGAWYYALNRKPYTGYAYALFPNGNMSYEYNLVNGYEEGIQKIWFPNGQLQVECYKKDNLTHGKSLEWFENGVLRFEAEYNMGLRVWYKMYNQEGELVKQYP